MPITRSETKKTPHSVNEIPSQNGRVAKATENQYSQPGVTKPVGDIVVVNKQSNTVPAHNSDGPDSNSQHNTVNKHK